MAKSKQENKITVLMLIGKTGNGKSSTANTILRDRLFVSDPNAPPEAKVIKQGVVQFEDRIVKVIDTPGFEDSQCNDETVLQLITSEIEKVLILCSEGIHACLIVLKYGSPLTADERQTIKHIQENFGDEFIKKYCIILMTNGDHFSLKEKNLTIEQWAEKQSGEFKDLYVACEKKIIMFDNSKVGDMRDQQIRQLLMKVDSLGGNVYTDTNFDKAKQTRKEMEVNAKRPIIRDQTMTEVSVINQELKKIYKMKTTGTYKDELKKLKARAEDLQSKINKEDNKTGVLNDLITYVRLLVANICDEIKFKEKIESELEQNKKSVKDSPQKAELSDSRLLDLYQQQQKEIMELNKIIMSRKCIVM